MKTNREAGARSLKNHPISTFFPDDEKFVAFLAQILEEVPKIRRAVSTSCFESRNLLLILWDFLLSREQRMDETSSEQRMDETSSLYYFHIKFRKCKQGLNKQFPHPSITQIALPLVAAK
jgi:hypothetical protein